MTTTTHGLVLDLPGAPETPHVIFGLEGYFVPGVPRSLEELGLTLAEAKELAADEGFPAQLATLKKAAKPKSKAKTSKTEAPAPAPATPAETGAEATPEEE